MKVLHVASEAYPLIKTGGLADVAYALPRAQKALKLDVRLLVPGYPSVMKGVTGLRVICDIGTAFGVSGIRLLKGKLTQAKLDVYVIDSPSFFNREGNPYLGPDGKEWNDNHRRFALLGWTAAMIAGGDLDRKWRPDIVHAHDWHAGLAPAYMAENPACKAKSVFTIHNLAFRGLFPFGESADLGFSVRNGLPHQFEFFSQISFLKAGVRFANKVTTVSPTYAKEVLSKEMGFGMEGVLSERGQDFIGILNGLDYDVWNPATDKQIAKMYSSATLSGKVACKKALQQEFGLEVNTDSPLFGVVSRLADQKGLDLVLSSIPQILEMGAQLIVLGSGDKNLENGFKAAATSNPGKIAAFIGYDEKLSHRLIAGVDALLVPSRFEPCGLTQMMALRYGTLPIVRRTGGLADTVTQVVANIGNGFVFDAPRTDALCASLRGAASLFADKKQWAAAVKRAIGCGFSWSESAKQYVALYESL